MKKIKTLILAVCCLPLCLFAQNTATVFGTITEGGTNTPIEFAIVYIKETNKTVETNAAGEYALKVPAGRALTLKVQRVGYKEATLTLEAMRAESQRRIDFALVSTTSQQEVVIKSDRLKESGMIREDVKDFRLLPTTTGNLESLLPALALGTNMGSGGELTSQYQVRGGNYDENLVYVNDFEVYRPQLIRAGQQEGLTFANPDLMRDLSFSSGGFEARYGDKMSSVLDIKYKRPDSTRGSVSASALGATAHLEGSRKLGKDGYRRFRYLVGARYKTTAYLLGSLDLQGEYVPNFGDIQTYLTYDISRSWQLAFLGNYNTSTFNFVPRSRASAFGLINFTLGVSTVFQGREQDKFVNGTTGVSLTYLPDRKRNPLFLKFLASRFQTRETEGIDIEGAYILGEVESNPNAQNAGQIKNVLGDGIQHQYVRNAFWGAVTNLEHRGGYEIELNGTPSVMKTSFLQWGVKYQNEQIEDRLNEWERLDSALYSLPFDTTRLLVRNVYKTRNSLNSNRITAFAQNTYTWRKDSVGEFQATLGARAQYWDLNSEAFVTPRLQLAYKPLGWQRDFSFRLAGGLYYQPPFYRELRRPNGTINVRSEDNNNTGLFAQKSAQVVGGLTYDFAIGKLRRIPFRIISEVYYKRLWDLVTYDVENVRIRYSGENDATGYVMGWDTRINGEFVPGAESWINFSLLRARESITSVTHKRREVGDPEGVAVKDVPRPTDQLMTLSVFFQDYLPKNKNFKMHMMTTIGTGLPFGFPGNNVIYRNTYRLKPYHRVDIGFSVMLWDEGWKSRRPRHFLRFTRQTWASLEVFNLMAVANEANKTWIKTIYNTQFAIPNYLTSRRVNLRLRTDF
jgi:hypothetical protein